MGLYETIWEVKWGYKRLGENMGRLGRISEDKRIGEDKGGYERLLEDMGGHGRIWEDMGGYRRIWEDIGGYAVLLRKPKSLTGAPKYP